ncbi:MAG: hypothetical protein AABZ60_02050 [Planctomycetota bacterium]
MTFIQKGMIGLVFTLAILCAEKKTYVQSATQIVGSNQSVNEVRPIALLEAKRLALEQAGTYVESITVSQDFEITKDEVLSLAAGIVETKVIDEKIETVSGAIKFTITIEAVIELADLEARIQELKSQGSNSNVLEENKALRDQNAEMERQLRELQAQLAQAKSAEEAKRLQDEANQGILQEAKAREELDKARTLIHQGEKDPSKFADAEKILKEVAALDPDLGMCDYYLQQVAWKQNKTLGAQIQFLQNALKKNPNLHMIRFELAKVYHETYKKNKKQQFYLNAVQELTTYIQADRTNPRGYIYLATIHALAAQEAPARQVLQDCLRNVPETPGTKRDLATVKQRLGMAGNSNQKPPRQPENPQNPPQNNQPVQVNQVDPQAIATAKVSIQYQNYPQALQVLAAATQPLEASFAKNPGNPQTCRDLARLYSTQAVVYGFLANMNGMISAYTKATLYWEKMGVPQPTDKPLIAADYYQLAHTYGTLVQKNPAQESRYHTKIVEALKGALLNGYTQGIIQAHPVLRNYLAEASK